MIINVSNETRSCGCCTDEVLEITGWCGAFNVKLKAYALYDPKKLLTSENVDEMLEELRKKLYELI